MVFVILYIYIYICFSMFSLHVQSCMHLKLAIGLCLYLCLFSFLRLGSSYPNKVVKFNVVVVCGTVP